MFVRTCNFENNSNIIVIAKIYSYMNNLKFCSI